jgi:hypothetical protein
MSALPTPPLNRMAFLNLPGSLPFLYEWFERPFKRWKDFELSEPAFEGFSLVLRTAQRDGVRDLVGRSLTHAWPRETTPFLPINRELVPPRT